MNLMMLLEMAAGGFGDRVAFGPAESGLTVRKLYERAGAAATHFCQTGAEHVAMVDVTSIALPISLFGAAWAGLPFVPVNSRLAHRSQGQHESLLPASPAQQPGLPA